MLEKKQDFGHGTDRHYVERGKPPRIPEPEEEQNKSRLSENADSFPMLRPPQTL